MSLWTCLTCTTRYSVGAPACPHCASIKYTDNPDGIPPQPEPAAKTTKDTKSLAPAPAKAAADGGG